MVDCSLLEGFFGRGMKGLSILVFLFMKRVMLVFGTRPEAIKMCPLVKEFQKCPEEFETIVCVTGMQKDAGQGAEVLRSEAGLSEAGAFDRYTALIIM